MKAKRNKKSSMNFFIFRCADIDSCTPIKNRTIKYLRVNKVGGGIKDKNRSLFGEVAALCFS